MEHSSLKIFNNNGKINSQFQCKLHVHNEPLILPFDAFAYPPYSAIIYNSNPPNLIFLICISLLSKQWETVGNFLELSITGGGVAMGQQGVSKI